MSLRQRSSKYIEIDDDFEDEVITKPKKNNALKSGGRPKCLKCNAQFSCKKSLAYHMMNRHSNQRKYYPCIYCKSVFSQFYGVTRHISRAHNMSGADIDKVRDVIRAKVFTKQSKNEAVAANAAISAVENAAADSANAAPPTEAMEDDIPDSILYESNSVDTSGEQELSSPSQGSKSDSSNSKRGRPAKNPLMKPQPQLSSELDQKDKDDQKGPMQLFVCKTCNKAFGKKIALERHNMVCMKILTLETTSALDKTKQTSDKPKVVENSNEKSLAHNKPKRKIKPKQYNDGTILMIPDVVKVKNPDGSTVYKLKDDIEKDKQQEQLEHESIDIDDNKLKVFVQGEWLSVLDKDEEAEVDKMVDGSRMICLKCKRGLSSVSDLRKHAVRHIDWKKFKCKLCRFFSFNRFDCKTHLRKHHAEDVGTLLDAGLLDYVIDLEICVFESMDAVKYGNAYQAAASGTSPLPANAADTSAAASVAANLSTRSSSREKRTITPSRPSKKQDSSKDTPKSTNSTRSEVSPSPSRKSDSTDSPSVEKRPRGRPKTVFAKKEESVKVKPRGRPRKHNKVEDVDGSGDHVNSDKCPPNKTSKLEVPGLESENDENESQKLQNPEPKLIKIVEKKADSDSQPAASKDIKTTNDETDDGRNATHNNLEDTITSMKNRKPLTADNGKAVTEENGTDK